MNRIEFQAWEYTSDDKFQESAYIFEGEEESGWKIYRNGIVYLELEPGYKLLKTKACGICSTDIDRRFLPFPLPQVIGHEVIAEDPTTGKSYVIEINDTLLARGSSRTDAFIESGLPTHSPLRYVLGIDRLPGGFGSYILAPKNSLIPYQGIPDRVAVMIEPFAAALQAISASPPNDGDNVAVLGPRRLGSLILSALSAYRKSSGKSFHITALTRRDEISQLSLNLGADAAINLRNIIDKDNNLTSLKLKFSTVYDTTSTEEGFLTALELADREVHLKSTNGQVMGGLNHLTELVVDELSILPFNMDNLGFHWTNESRKNQKVFVTPSLSKDKSSFIDLKNILIKNGFTTIDSLDRAEAVMKMKSLEDNNLFPRYDLAIASNIQEIEECIRPIEGSQESLVRPRGAILYLTDSNKHNSDTSPLEKFFQRGGRIRSSRCGDFHSSIRLLIDNPQVVEAMEKNMITHSFPAEKLPEAYRIAMTPQAIKVMVVH